MVIRRVLHASVLHCDELPARPASRLAALTSPSTQPAATDEASLVFEVHATSRRDPAG